MTDVAPKAVVLLSGGIDSTTTLAIARDEGLACYALSFDYGQRHRVELVAAANVAKAFGVIDHRIANIDLRAFGGSALTDDIDVPKDRPPDVMNEGIPITYVPARNTIFLSFALAYAEVLSATDIFIGVNTIHTPLIDLTKAQIIKRGIALGVDYSRTFSCYDPQSDDRPCGHCDSCLLRAEGFRQAGTVDPSTA